MTLPASGSISTAQIRTELGGSGVVIIPDAETRALTGVSSGPIVLPNDFWGKTKPSSLTATNNGPASAAGGGPLQTTNNVTATPSGGTAPYTYAWSYVSGDTFTITSPTSATTSFSKTTVNGQSYDGIYKCVVTDAVSATATTNVAVAIDDTDP